MQTIAHSGCKLIESGKVVEIELQLQTAWAGINGEPDQSILNPSSSMSW